MAPSKSLKSPEPGRKPPALRLYRSWIRLVLLSVSFFVLLIGAAWAFGALWFEPSFRFASTSGSCVWLSAIGALVFLRRHWRAQVGVAGEIVLVAVWWLTIRPSNTRDWQTEVAQTPYPEIEGDGVMINNFRNFDYITKTDFVPRWETKTVHLSNLRTVDFFTNYWGSTLICHTFVSFDFGPEGYVCISIETRMKKGQAYFLDKKLFIC